MDPTYTTKSTIVIYSDSASANILPHPRPMQAKIVTLNGVAISWQTNIQHTVYTDSTDAKMKALYCTCKRAIAFQHFLTSSNFRDDINRKITIFADNIAAVGLIKSNCLTKCSCHKIIPIAFS